MNPDNTPKIRPNVFFFSMRHPSPEEALAGTITPKLFIQRLDEQCLPSYDMDALLACDRADSGKKFDNSFGVAGEKVRVLRILGIPSESQLSGKEINLNAGTEAGHLDDTLGRDMERLRGKCYKRFWESHDVARLAYCRLLLHDKKT